MLRFIIPLAAALVLALPPPAEALLSLEELEARKRELEAEIREKAVERFQLWTDCEPLRLQVFLNMHADTGAIGLTQEAVEIAVRSRLRAARIYDADAFKADLRVSVTTAGPAFHIDLKLFKFVTDWQSEELKKAPTWSTGGTGMHGGNGGFILDIIDQYTDEFIDEYLRVNADAC